MPRQPTAPPLKLYLLGPFRLENESGTMHLPTRKIESLFAYLVLYPQVHSREKLATIFWGDSAEARARQSLRTSLSTLRKELGRELLLIDRETVQLNPDFPLWVDVRELAQVATDKVELLDAKILSRVTCPSSLYLGDLLADFYDDWIAGPREHFRVLYLDLLLRVAKHLRAQGEHAQAIEFAKQVLATDAANEQAHQLLMLSYIALGKQASAARQYEAFRQHLKDDLGVAPSAETTAIYQWIKKREGIALPFQRIVTNLPIPLSSFIGRMDEIRELKELVSRTRLLTLTGAGGSGKTRLVIQVATELIDAFREGAWRVDLAPLTDDALVPQALAKALAVREVPGQPLTETLFIFLHTQHLLLILDNCEHLTIACAQLAHALLGACPHLKILATSREALGITGETVYQVPTLSLPDSQKSIPPEKLIEYEGIRLFVERARAVKSDFVLSDTSTASVMQICRRLDGIPLAIELAAARIKVLSAEQIAARLDQRFQLLTGGSRGAPPRHQTLRATIDWSFDLLPADAQILFRRLSVFSGGFTLDAAEAVCSDELLSWRAVLDLVARLVDRSLIMVEQLRGDARYYMLETIRQYAQEKLFEVGESEQVNVRHAIFFLELAEAAEPKITSAQRHAWFERLRVEDDNLRTALEWSQGAADSGLMQQRLAGALSWFWEQRGYLSEGRRWLVAALAHPDAAFTTPARAKVLTGIGYLAMHQGDAAESRDALEESIRLWRSSGDTGRRGLAFALNFLGDLTRHQGDPYRAQGLVEEGVALFQELGETWGVAWALNFLGLAHRDHEHYELARRVLSESIALWQRLGDSWGVAFSMRSFGSVAYREGKYPEARSHFEASLALEREIGDKRSLTHVYKNLGLVAMNQAEDELAKQYLEEAMALSRYQEDKFSIAEVLLYQGTLAMFEGDVALAESLFQQSLPLARVTIPLWLRASAVGRVAGVAARRGQPDRAARLWGAFETGVVAAASFVDAADQRYFDCTVAQARDQLGIEAFEVLRTEGHVLKMEQAIEYALKT